MKIFRAFLFSILTVFVLACTAQSAKEKTAPALRVSEKTRVAIPKSGFGKEYMLSTSIIPQFGAPTSTGMNGRVVLFEQFEDGVDMYETTRGQVVTDALPARRLLATFPIIEADGNAVVIDFNAGMRRLNYGVWYSMELGYSPTVFDRSAEIPQARVFETRSENGTLTIRQAVQVRSRTTEPDLESRYEIRYFISPYDVGDFEGREVSMEERRHARFFETAGNLELDSGRVSKRISLFDVTEPIVFYYSANTPEHLQEAVRDGILYWNKAFGKEAVKALKAPDGVTAPNPDLNMVQWVSWDLAGFAYADLLLDPLTGESLRGQSYLTSAFDFGGREQARRLLRSLRSMVKESKGTKDGKGEDGAGGEEKFPGIHSFSGHVGCEMNSVAMAVALSEGLEALLADPKLSEEVVVRMAQDFVREVTAHEVGHVLGLRHNFAASLSATLSPMELDQFLADYIAGEDLSKYKDKLASTSVMEYSIFSATLFAGWQIHNRDTALDHDAAAIRWGYFDDKKVVEEKQLFGSEEESRIYADVQRFDYGSDPILAEYRELSDVVRKVPGSILERFIAARAPADARDRKSLEAVEINADDFASRIAEPVRVMLKWFSKKTRSLKVENAFAALGDLNEDERSVAHWDYLTKQLDRLGGVDQVMFAHLPAKLSLKTDKKLEGVEVAPKVDAAALKKSLETLLASPAYATFVGLDGESYTWTDEEKKVILARSAKLFEKLEEAVLLKTLQLYEDAPRDLGLRATGNLSDDDSVAKLEARIIELAKFVVLERKKENRIRGKVDKAFVEVPDFTFDYATRMAAAKALNDKTGSFESWAKEAKQELNAALKSAVEESLNIGLFKDFDDKLLSRSLREWYLQEQGLLKLLPADSKK